MNELISGVRADVAIKVYGDDLDTLLEVAQRIEAVAKGRRRRRREGWSRSPGLPLLTVTPDRGGAGRYGLNPATCRTRGDGGGWRGGGPAVRGRSPLRHRRAPARTSRQDPCGAGRLPIPLPNGRHRGNRRDQPRRAWRRRAARHVPLREVARIETDLGGPNQINRENGKRRIVVTANVRGRDLGSFVGELREEIDADVECRPGTGSTTAAPSSS
ncbi:MAG: efflux RND transporter permease subunit [Chiayiivirga sp.]|nr:efflux RND transporter permease subunit [Chiayiivirga sp.]